MNKNWVMRFKVDQIEENKFKIVWKILHYLGTRYHAHILCRSLWKDSSELYSSGRFEDVLPQTKTEIELEPNDLRYITRMLKCKKTEILRYFQFKLIVHKVDANLLKLTHMLFKAGWYPKIYIWEVSENDGLSTLKFLDKLKNFDNSSLIEVKIRLCSYYSYELFAISELVNWNVTEDVLEGFKEKSGSESNDINDLVPLALCRGYTCTKLRCEWKSIDEFYARKTSYRFKPYFNSHIKKLQIDWIHTEPDEKDDLKIYRNFTKFIKFNVSGLKHLESISFVSKNLEIDSIYLLKTIWKVNWGTTEVIYEQNIRPIHEELDIKVSWGMILIIRSNNIPQFINISEINWRRFSLENAVYSYGDVTGVVLKNYNQIGFKIGKVNNRTALYPIEGAIQDFPKDTPILFFKNENITELYSTSFPIDIYPMCRNANIEVVLNWKELYEVSKCQYWRDIKKRDKMKIILDFDHDRWIDKEEDQDLEAELDIDNDYDFEKIITPEIKSVKRIAHKICEIRTEVFDSVNNVRINEIMENAIHLNKISTSFNHEENLICLLENMERSRLNWNFYGTLYDFPPSDECINFISNYLNSIPKVNFKMIFKHDRHESIFQTINPLEPTYFKYLNNKQEIALR